MEAGEAPTKACPNCRQVVLLGARECPCGFLFPADESKEFTQAGTAAVLSEPEVWEVVEVHAQAWKKKGWEEGDPRTVRVTYSCQPVDGEGGDLELTRISEWVCVEHGGFAGEKAMRWWAERCGDPMPTDANDAVLAFEDGLVARPRRITTIRDGRWYRVVEAELEEVPESAGYDDEWEEVF